MTTAMLLTAVLQYGPQIIPLVAKLVADIKAGKGQQEPTEADWAELVRLAGQSSADIYAREGITPPPPTAPGS